MKKLILLWGGPLLLILFCLTQQANAQCNESQPRPITGAANPCPGEIIYYSIENDRNYTSFEWDVPRAAEGEPPVGWEILSGQGTRQVQVRVGQKSGTMKVKIADKVCGTKVATMPVKPGKSFEVIIAGPEAVCANELQAYSASVKKENGNGTVKGEFAYNWTVPKGWTIRNGQGSDKIEVMPSATPGEVNLYVSTTAQSSGNGNNGNGGNGKPNNGVGGNGYCGNGSDGLLVDLKDNCSQACPTISAFALALPDTVCNLSDNTYFFKVAEVQEGVGYEFILPEGFIIVDEGEGFVEVVAVLEEDQFGKQNISVIARNDCGEKTVTASVVVSDCSDGELSGNEPESPLPVTMTRFTGISRNEAVELAWGTATEINNDRFEVERSYDAKAFAKIGEVQGNGNSTVTQEYTFTDTFANKGTVYYRLRQIDFDNAFEYSKVIAVRHEGSLIGSNVSLSMYPNPVADGKVTLRLVNNSPSEGNSPSESQWNLRLADLNGRILHTATMNANIHETSLDIRSLGLGQGIYLISVTDGGNTSTQRLVVR